MKDIIMNK